MPQEFQVLRCFSCGTFQVHQVKKVVKYNCKVCGEKQSIKKVYGRGTGADCRKHVQKCNMMRCELDMAAEQKLDNAENNTQEPAPSELSDAQTNEERPSANKWADYLDTQDNEVEADDDDEQYTTNRQDFNQVRKEERKAARQRWKQQKYERYNNSSETASAEQACQKFGGSRRENYGTSTIPYGNQNFSDRRSYQSPVDNDYNSSKEMTTKLHSNSGKYGNGERSIFNRQTVPSAHCENNDSMLFPMPHSTKMTGALSDNTESGFTTSSVSSFEPNKEKMIKNSVFVKDPKLSKSKKSERNKQKNSAGQRQSKWSAFLGTENNESSDSEDENFESADNFMSLGNHNFSAAGVCDSPQFKCEWNDETESEQFESKNDTENYREITAQFAVPCKTDLVKNAVDGDCKISETRSVSSANEKALFNVDTDLENILDEDW